jgi:C4-dicarboxylate transporter, DctQ subunit
MRSWSSGPVLRSRRMPAEQTRGVPAPCRRTAPLLLRSWERMERFIVGLLAAFGLFAALYEAVTRYALPQYAGQWANETVVYALIWAVFLASSTLVGTDGHVRADLFLRVMPHGARRAVEIFNTAIALIFTIALTYYGVLITWEGYLFDERSMTTLRFPMWIYFACVPVGGALMVMRYLRRLYLLVLTQDPAILEFDQHTPSTVD